MEPTTLLAIVSREFLQIKKVYRYRMKKVADMTDREIISNCHAYCEENNLVPEWNEFRKKTETEYRYCPYLEEYIDNGLCYDLQMIAGDYIKAIALPEIAIDKTMCAKCCFECKYRI